MGVLTTDNIQDVKDLSSSNFSKESSLLFYDSDKNEMGKEKVKEFYEKVISDNDNFYKNFVEYFVSYENIQDTSKSDYRFKNNQYMYKLANLVDALFDECFVNVYATGGLQIKSTYARGMLDKIIQDKITKSATESSLPIGFTYIQFPYMQDPVSLGCAGTWEDISHKFDSMFMRIAGDMAKIPYKHYGTLEGYTGDDGYVKRCIKMSGIDSSCIGQIILCSNGEKRLIVDVTTQGMSELEISLGNKRAVYKTLDGSTKELSESDIADGFFIVQGDTIKKHTHIVGDSNPHYLTTGWGTLKTESSDSSFFTPLSAYSGESNVGFKNIADTKIGLNVEQSETRPMNITVTIWQRVS